MENLHAYWTPPSYTLPFDILYFKKHCETVGGRLVMMHQFLHFVHYNHEKYFIKINLADQEYYVFSKHSSIVFFHSMDEVIEWFETNVFQKGVSTC